MALSADGTTALVGAPRTREYLGSAWVFTLSGSTWSEQAELIGTGEEATGKSQECAAAPEECSFGRSVSLSADGNTALVGAPRNDSFHGAAIVYVREGTSWSRQAVLNGGEEENGAGSLGRASHCRPTG